MASDAAFEAIRELEGITAVTITTDAAGVEVVAADPGDDVTAITLVERDGTPRPDLLAVAQVRDEARIAVRTVRDGRWRRNRTIDVRLMVRTPRGSIVDVESDAGAVRIEGRDAAVAVRSTAGLVFVRDVHATVDVESSAGKVTLTECVGDARVTGLAGAVRIDRHRGERVTLTASAGGVKGDALEVEHLEAKTEAGAILLRFDSPPTEVVASCTVGAITLSVPPGEYEIEQGSGPLSRTRVMGIEHVPGADRRIRAVSSVGAVTISLAEPAHA